MSTLLFHGPGALSESLTQASQIGRLLADPFGGDGLTIDTSREIVEMLSVSPLGDKKGVVIIGPVDRPASIEALDGLLKLLEDYDEKYVQPILWAWDLEEVRVTLRSRSLETWCPGTGSSGMDAAYMRPAKDLCEAALRRKTAQVIEILKEYKGQEAELLRASARVLTEETTWPIHARLVLWAALRPVMLHHKPGPLLEETVAAYLV